MSEIFIPNMHAWRWRAQVLTEKTALQPISDALPQEVSYFFDNYHFYNPGSRVQGSEAYVTWSETSAIQRKVSLEKTLPMIAVERVRGMPSAARVSITDVEALKDYIAITPFGPLNTPIRVNWESGFKGRHVNTTAFYTAMATVLDATVDGSIYQIAHPAMPKTDIEPTSLDELIEATETQTALAPQLTREYAMRIHTWPLQRIVQEASLIETVRALGNNLA